MVIIIVLVVVVVLLLLLLPLLLLLIIIIIKLNMIVAGDGRVMGGGRDAARFCGPAAQGGLEPGRLQ